MSVIITIVVVIILAAILISATSQVPEEATYAKFCDEVQNVEEGIQQIRLKNAYRGDTQDKINLGFKYVTLIGAPAEFQSFDKSGTKVTGYIADLSLIQYENAEFGEDYAIQKEELEFTKDDVYVYDSSGTVYYVKGTYYQEKRIHRPLNESLDVVSTEDGPIIHNIEVVSGELADGTKTSSKAKIIITASPRYDGKLTVMVRELIADELPNGTFATQVSKNGVYTVVVTEENGGRTVQRVTVTGIIETNIAPSNLSIYVVDGPNITKPNVDLILRADGATKMIIAENNALKPNASDSRWEDFKDKYDDYTLKSEEGRVTLYAWFKNDFGNVTDEIVKASILYDTNPPSQDAPTLTISGPYVIVEPNQKDNVSSDEYLLSKTETGYKLSSVVGNDEDKYEWISGTLIGPLQNGETYDIATRTIDEVGHKSISAPVTITIKFDYLIEFDLNGGPGEMDSIYTRDGESITLVIPPVQRPGYNFVGWSENKDATSENIGEIKYAGDIYIPEGNITTKTLYAIWSPKTNITYKVEHYVEKKDSTGEYEIKFTDIFNNGKFDDFVYAVAKVDGDFVGYTENTSHSQRVASAKITSEDNIVLKLFYYRAKYNLTVKGENATASGSASDVPYEAEIGISATPLEGFEFVEWIIEGENTNSSAYANFVNDGGNKNPNAIFKMIARDTILTAKAKLKTYDIEYDLKGGNVSESNPTEYTKSTLAFTLNNPSKAGYDFAGWIGTDLNGPTQNVTIDPSKLVNFVDRKYTATYTPKEELLTITATPRELTKDSVRVTIECLDEELRVEYRIGLEDTWKMYASSFEIEENTTVYARAMSKDGELIDQESLVIDYIDRVLPVISDVSISDNWNYGTKLLVNVTATDNNSIISGYAVTTTETQPTDSAFQTSNDRLMLEEGINYIWVKDAAGNLAYETVDAWDISYDNTKLIYALLKNDTELIIKGEGETASYTEDTVPYKDYKSQITNVVIKEDVEVVGDYVLSNMENVVSIELPNSLTTLKDNAMIRTNNYENIIIAQGNNNFVYDNYALYNKDKTVLYMHSRKDTNTEYTLPNSVSVIKQYAFYENDNLSILNVTSNPNVENNVFENCSSLYEIKGQIGGTAIGKEAFYMCEDLHALQVSNTLQSLGEAAFKDTVKLSVIEIPNTITSIVNPQTSVSGVFENIGINSNNTNKQGIVRYYQSSEIMSAYAQKYESEAEFVMIDDIKPTLVDLSITSPESGTYSQDQVVKFTATFSETLKVSSDILFPTLTIKVGDGENKNITAVELNGNKLVYTYVIETGDSGKIELVNYSGNVVDLAENIGVIETTTLGGNEIYVDTVVSLMQNGVMTYYGSLAQALDNVIADGTTRAVVTLLKGIDESVVVKANTYVVLDINKQNFSNTSLNAAITNNGRLEIANGTITSNGIVIDTKSNTKLSLEFVNLTTISGPSIKANEDSEVIINNSEVKSTNGYSINVLENSRVTITNSIVESTNNTAINNKGYVEISETEKTTIKGTIGIISTGTVKLLSGTIEGNDSTGCAVENQGIFEMLGGTISANAGTAVKNTNGTFSMTSGLIKTTDANKNAFENEVNATLTISGASTITAKGGSALLNKGTASVTGNESNIIIISSEGLIVVENKGDLTTNKASITTTSLQGAAIVNEGTYTDAESKITAGKVGVENKVNGNVKLNATIVTVDNTTESVTGILASSAQNTELTNVKVNVKTTTGDAIGIKIENSSNVYVTESLVNSVATNGTSYGAYNNKGNLIMGANDNAVLYNTIIEGGTHGYYSENGVLRYFDGRFGGEKTKALVGNVTEKPEYSYIDYVISGDKEYTIMKVDKVSPSSVVLEASTTAWTNKEITLTGRATDVDSGIWKYAITTSSARPQESEWTESTEFPSNFETQKVVTESNTFYLHVLDRAGNYVCSEGVQTRYDIEPPRITDKFKEPSGWTSGNVTIKVEVEDTISGVAAYEFTTTYHDTTVSGDTYKTINPEVNTGVLSSHPISENGTIYIYIYDQAGNVVYEEYEVDTIDTTAPKIKYELHEEGDNFIKVKVTATDEQSGVKTIYVDGVEQELQATENPNEKYIIYTINKAGETKIIAEDNVLNESEEIIETFKITYDSMGGTGVMPSHIKLKDVEITILENKFVKDTYEFVKWNTASDYSGADYASGVKYTANENATLYAVWRDNTPPDVTDIYLSENWVVNNNMLIKIIAKDNEDVTGYAITTSQTAPSSWSETNEVEITLGNNVYYVWTIDAENNTAYEEVKIYDLSKAEAPKTTIGILKDFDNDEIEDYELSIEGQGAVKDLTKSSKPWQTSIDKIAKVTVKEGITSIGEYAIADLTNADEISLSSTVSQIALTSFIHTNNYSALTLEGNNFKNVSGMLEDANETTIYVASTKLTTGNIVTSANLTNIAPYAFENSTITSITLPRNIDILEGTFKNAVSLETIHGEVKLGVTTIGADAFYNAKKLTGITINKDVTTLEGTTIFENIGKDAGTETGKGYVYYYDSNALMSAYATNEGTKDQATFIGIDDVLPEVKEVIINDGAIVTNNKTVTVKVTATDNREVTEIFITDDETLTPNGAENGWITKADSYTYDLKEETGEQTLYVWAKDATGNISETSGSDSITLVVYNFEMNGNEEVIQYKDTTGKDYYEYRDKGITIDNEDITVDIINDVDHETVNTYDVQYVLKYEGNEIERIVRKVHIIENDWKTEVIADGEFSYVLHNMDKPYAKLVSFVNNEGENTLTIPDTFTYNNVEYKVIDVGSVDGNTSISAQNETAVQKIVLGNNVIAVSDYAFNNFKNVSSLEYSQNLMTIGRYAFENSTAEYPKVTIKENVREVKEGAFENSIIDLIEIKEGVRSIEERAFHTQNGINKGSTLTIPASIDNIGVMAFRGYEANQIAVSEENTKYASEDGLTLTDKAGKVIYQYAIGNTATEYTVDTKVETIEAGAFSESENLQKVTLASATTKIAEKAFKNAENLVALENTKQITEVGSEAFANTKLKSIVFEGESVIVGDAFKDTNTFKYLVSINKTQMMTVNGTLELPSQASVYVLTTDLRDDYLTDTSAWKDLGDARILLIAELIGEEEIEVIDNASYVEQGIKLLGETIATFDVNNMATSSVDSKFTVEYESSLGDEVLGNFDIRYIVKYEGKELITLERIVKLMDQTVPEIDDIITSSTWTSGNPLEIELIASDNKNDASDLVYAVSTVLGDTLASWNSSNKLTLTEGTNYVHVKDTSGNIKVVEVKAWDISKNEDETVFAYEKKNKEDVENDSKELVITGTGITKDYTAKNQGPWSEDQTKITKLTIEEAVSSLGNYSLSGLENVDAITIPSTLGVSTSIATNAFAGTNNFSSIVVAEGNTALKVESVYTLTSENGEIIYAHSRRDTATEYTIAMPVTLVAENAFYNNNNIQTINMNNAVNLGKGAFEGMLTLETIEGEIGNTTIESNAFSGDINLKDIIISNSVTTLGTKIFTKVPGPVKYYATCTAMREYATTYADETKYIIIDNLAPNDTAPTLESSSAVIKVIFNQTDLDSGISKKEYLIRKDGEEYDETKWQTEPYFTNLSAETTYYVKTRATDGAIPTPNVAESKEALIETKAVPTSIEIAAIPYGPTSGDVTVEVKWPVTIIDELYGDKFEGNATITKQIGVKNSGDTEISWTDYNDNNSTFVHTVTQNGTTVYARLYDGTNVTQAKSLQVLNIDKIAPEGTVSINDGAEETLENVVELTLVARDDRNDEGFGVKYYYATEDKNVDLNNVTWQEYQSGVKVSFEFSTTTSIKTVYVWYKDAAGNISTVCSDEIMLITKNIMLEQDGETTYYMSMTETVAAVKENIPAKVTLINTLSESSSVAISENKNIVIDMNGNSLSYTGEGDLTYITNAGLLTIINSAETTKASTIHVVSSNGKAVGIENIGHLEIISVSVNAESPNDTSVGILNRNDDKNDGWECEKGSHVLDESGTKCSICGKETIAQVMYFEEDNTLTFASTLDTYESADIYEGKEVTSAYTEIETDTYLSAEEVPWNSIANDVTNVNFEDSIQPISTAYWFNNFSNCTTYNLENLDTSNTTNMSNMFANSGVQELDLSNFDTSKVSNITNMFTGANKLQKVTIGENFKFEGDGTTSCELPTQSSENINGADGYWYDVTAENKYNSEDIPSNVHATYVAVLNNITYELNGGKVDTENPTKYTGCIDVTLNNPTKVGYTFAGWTGSNGETPEKDLVIYSGDEGHKSYIANWTANTDILYKVNHWQQKVTGGEEHNSDNYDLVIADSYEEKGTTDEEITPEVKHYEGFEEIEPQTVKISGDGTTVVDYYYNRISYTVELQKGTGIASVSGNGTYRYEAEVTINAEVSEGYTWSNWTGIYNTPQKEYTFIMPSTNVVNTANATANTYTIQYEGNRSTGGSTESSIHIYDESKELTLNGFQRDNHNFIGWNTMADGSGISYTDGESVINLATENNATVVLYAQWEVVFSIPTFTYDGDYEIVDDNDEPISNPETYIGDWKIKFLSSGTLTFTTDNGISDGIDIFGVGGGGAGTSTLYATAGGGGYTKTINSAYVEKNKEYSIVVGAGGAKTNTSVGNDGEASKFGDILTAPGGYGGQAGQTGKGGDGGSGGAGYAGVGGVDGDNCTIFTTTPGGNGQGTTTREFGESDGKLYANGGNGQSHWTNEYIDNSGNGGDATWGDSTAGSSGIVIIRNTRFIKQAVYSADDNSLTFISDNSLRDVNGNIIVDSFTSKDGTTKSVTEVYTGFEKNSYTYNSVPWADKRDVIESVEIRDNIKPLYMNYWFADFSNCANYDLNNLNITSVISMESMFENSAVNVINVVTWDTSNVTSMERMFYNCTELTEIKMGANFGQSTNIPTAGSNEGMFFVEETSPLKIYNPNEIMKSYYYSTDNRTLTIQIVSIPTFTYTGDYEIVDDNDEPISNPETYVGDWKIRFLTSGTFTINELNNLNDGIDIFLVGGGGGSNSGPSGGGGGGYTKTLRNVNVQQGNTYEIVIGAGGVEYRAGETTSAFGHSVDGGQPGRYHTSDFPTVGGDGGSGGSGGVDGSDGSNCTGQGTTTREFGEANAKLYSTGGATVNTDGLPNTGDGGGPCGWDNHYGGHPGRTGGSGIVVIRNSRSTDEDESSKLEEITLFGNNIQETTLSGGITTEGYTYDGSSTYGNYAEIGSSNIALKAISGSEVNNWSIVGTNNTIDLTNYSQIEATVNFNNYTSSSKFYMGVSTSKSAPDNYLSRKEITSSGTYTLDVSGVDLDAYIWFAACDTYSATLYVSTMNISEVKLIADKFTWQNGNVLFENGEQSVTLSGGITKEGYTYNGSTTYGNYAEIETNIALKAISGSEINNWSVAGTNNKIDLTKYSEIQITLSFNSYVTSSKFYVGVSDSKSVPDNYISRVQVTGDGTYTLDVSDVNTEAYIWFSAGETYSGGAYVSTMKISKVELVE